MTRLTQKFYEVRANVKEFNVEMEGGLPLVVEGVFSHKLIVINRVDLMNRVNDEKH